jgi:hypothetical protein
MGPEEIIRFPAPFIPPDSLIVTIFYRIRTFAFVMLEACVGQAEASGGGAFRT